LSIGPSQLAQTFAFLPEFVQTQSSADYGFGASITRSGLLLRRTLARAGLSGGQPQS